MRFYITIFVALIASIAFVQAKATSKEGQTDIGAAMDLGDQPAPTNVSSPDLIKPVTPVPVVVPGNTTMNTTMTTETTLEQTNTTLATSTATAPSSMMANNTEMANMTTLAPETTTTKGNSVVVTSMSAVSLCLISFLVIS